MKTNFTKQNVLALVTLLLLLLNCTEKSYLAIPQPTTTRLIEHNPYLTYGILRDTDGNVYPTIAIGKQVWMAENLRTTRYSNGELIPYLPTNAQWESTTTGAQSVYNNSTHPDTILKYGRLYNFYAVSDNRHLAPKGWHVASDIEWMKLIKYISEHLGNSPSVGKALAASTEWAWVSDKEVFSDLLAIGADPSFNNSSGFSGMPGGYRADFGGFNSMSRYGDWWTSTQEDAKTAWSRYMYFYYNGVYWSRDALNYGFAVRCVKDE